MARATRSGKQFSPYEIDSIHINGRLCEIVRTRASLDTLVAEAMAASDAREAQLDDAGNTYGAAALEDGDDEWEDVDLFSRAPSPLSSTPTSPTASPSTSRSPSPVPSPAVPLCNARIPSASSSNMQPRAPDGRAESDRKRRGAAARRQRRNVKNAAKTPYDRVPDVRYSQAYREQSPHSVDIDATHLPASTGAWIGKRSKGSRRLYTLPELEEQGCQYLEWNGRDPRLILDCEGRIIAVLLGKPDDPDWEDVTKEAFKELRRARRYFPITAGASFGGGQRRPGNLRNSRRIRRLLRRLLRNKSIRRIMGFQSMGFALYAPKLYKHYCRVLKELFRRHPDLVHLFHNSIFPAATFNCGPDTFTFDHVDIQNLPNGFCGVTSGGLFDHKLGGHMYLKQLRLVIEFPSGASMLIPSGCVNHGNTPIAPGEERHSITQYAAGGLFRWAAYGFQTVKELLTKEGGRKLKQEIDGPDGARWRSAMDLFSKVDELEGDRASVL